MSAPNDANPPRAAGPLGRAMASLCPRMAAAAAALAAVTAAFAALVPSVSSGQPAQLSVSWIPSLDIALSFHVDGLALLFALLITGIGTAVMLYSAAYFVDHPRRMRFTLYLLSFTAAMLGLVLADNLITLFVFWELTTVTSFLLIGFTHDKPVSRRNALQALIVTGIGGLALLAGLLLLGAAAGTLELSEMRAQGLNLADHPHYLAILILVLAGAFTKSAQFPFHFWLPNAMAAPTPVSAFLHSATMVKAGVYLLARLHPNLGGTDIWLWTLTIVGAVTAVLASILAVRQTDLKLMLAYTTLMALGTLVLLLGNGVEIAIVAAVTFLLVHALYKAALFLVIGILDHKTGTRDRLELAGLARAMPITFVAAAVAALSMAGFPPFLGFIGKELKYEGALAVASEPVFVTGALVAANALMVAVAGIVGLVPFLGTLKPTPKTPADPPVAMWIGPAVLAALGILLGVAPALIAEAIVQPAASAIALAEVDKPLKLWHGVNVPLILSIITVSAGALLFWRRYVVMRALAWVDDRLSLSGDRVYDAAMAGFVALADWQTRVLQNGMLRRYMLTVLASIGSAVLLTLIYTGALDAPTGGPAPTPIEIAIIVLILCGAMLTILTRSNLTAICALGMVGTGVALLFLIYGAVDVAMTQLLVETLVIVLAAVAFLKLPRFTEPEHPGRAARVRDATVAVVLGCAVAGTLLAVLSVPFDRRLTSFFEAESAVSAFGRNIVNVILVDFRALDTFGEIAVVAIAGLGAYALIKLRPAGAAKEEPR